MVPASSVDAATALLEARGIRTWAMGEVHEAATAPIEDGVEVVSGAKGVDGGSVQVVGSHPSSA
jgi:phosphoribosylformylglycinamidine cyclo-ligase